MNDVRHILPEIEIIHILYIYSEKSTANHLIPGHWEMFPSVKNVFTTRRVTQGVTTEESDDEYYLLFGH